MRSYFRQTQSLLKQEYMPIFHLWLCGNMTCYCSVGVKNIQFKTQNLMIPHVMVLPIFYPQNFMRFPMICAYFSRLNCIFKAGWGDIFLAHLYKFFVFLWMSFVNIFVRIWTKLWYITLPVTLFARFHIVRFVRSCHNRIWINSKQDFPNRALVQDQKIILQNKPINFCFWKRCCGRWVPPRRFYRRCFSNRSMIWMSAHIWWTFSNVGNRLTRTYFCATIQPKFNTNLCGFCCLSLSRGVQKLNKGTGCESRTVTAAVSAEAVSVGESQSLGKPEKAGYGRRKLLHRRKSEDLQRNETVVCVGNGWDFSAQKNGCGSHMIATAVLTFLRAFYRRWLYGRKELPLFCA